MLFLGGGDLEDRFEGFYREKFGGFVGKNLGATEIGRALVWDWGFFGI